MKMKTIHAAVAVALLASGGSAFAQSPLADAARREAARRKAVRDASVPVYTNADIQRLPERAAPVRPQPPASSETTVTTAGVGGETSDAPAGAITPAPAAEAAPAEPSRRLDATAWRARITTARSNLSRATMFAEALQSRINGLTVDFTNRDDPAQRQQLFDQRQQALDELSRVQAEIAAFTQEIRDIEEEARRLGVPPGWLR